jgi:hypothetical protein
VEAIDQGRKRVLVTRAKRREQLRVLVERCGRVLADRVTLASGVRSGAGVTNDLLGGP